MFGWSWIVRPEPIWAKNRFKHRSTSEMASGGNFGSILALSGVDFGRIWGRFGWIWDRFGLIFCIFPTFLEFALRCEKCATSVVKVLFPKRKCIQRRCLEGRRSSLHLSALPVLGQTGSIGIGRRPGGFLLGPFSEGKMR